MGCKTQLPQVYRRSSVAHLVPVCSPARLPFGSVVQAHSHRPTRHHPGAALCDMPLCLRADRPSIVACHMPLSRMSQHQAPSSLSRCRSGASEEPLSPRTSRPAISGTSRAPLHTSTRCATPHGAFLLCAVSCFACAQVRPAQLTAHKPAPVSGSPALRRTRCQSR